VKDLSVQWRLKFKHKKRKKIVHIKVTELMIIFVKAKDLIKYLSLAPFKFRGPTTLKHLKFLKAADSRGGISRRHKINDESYGTM